MRFNEFPRVAATLDPQAIPAADVILFQCKAYVNEAAARSVRHLVTGATVAQLGDSYPSALYNSARFGPGRVDGGDRARSPRVDRRSGAQTDRPTRAG